MPIAMGFRRDFDKHLRAELVAAGFVEASDVAKMSGEEAGVLYFNTMIRTIPPAPRTVLFSMRLPGALAM